MCRCIFVFAFVFINCMACNTNIILSSTNSTHINEEWHCNNGTLLSSSICIPYGYLKGEVPEKPTIVKTRIEINNILEVSDKKMRMILDFYQELFWIDNRIKTNIPNNDSIVLNNELIRSIWKPDLWIKNLFNFKIHGVLEPTSGLSIANENHCKSEKCTKENMKRNTRITYNLEAQATIYCNFQFFYYPMDYQKCDFMMDGAYPRPGIVLSLIHI